MKRKRVPSRSGPKLIRERGGNNTIVINKPIVSYIQDTINKGTTNIQTGLTTVSFPDHGFNKIISIQNTTGFPTGQTYGNLLLVQTQLAHNYSSGDMVRLAETNSTPVINGGYNITVKTSDTFTIPYSFPITSSGNSGTTTFHQNFYILVFLRLHPFLGRLRPHVLQILCL